MDTSYVFLSAEQAAPGLILVALPIAFLAYGAKPSRRLLACLPGLASLGVFLVACVLGGMNSHGVPDALEYAHFAAVVISALLVAPAIAALRNRWLGLLHVSTLAGTAYLFFVGAMAISHDWL